MVDREAIIRGAKTELARREFFFYCHLKAPDFYKEERKYLIDLCNEFQDFIQSDDEVMVVNEPPRHGKSRTAGLLVEWVLGNDQTQKIMTGSYNETLSTMFSKNVRNDIMEEKADENRIVFSDIFPGVSIKRGDGAMNLWSLEGGYNNSLATSPTGTATGFGASLLIIDDLIKNAEEANNELTKEKHWSWFTDTMLSRLEEGGKIIQETRTWDEKEGITKSMRSKEEANDYRYFPEPDLVPFTVSKEYIEEIRKTLPELPDARKERYMRCFGLSSEDAVMMTNDKGRSDYFEAVVKAGADPKAAVNWLMGEFASQLSTDGIEIAAAPVTAENLAELLKLISKGTISGKIAKKVFADMWKDGGGAEEIVRVKGLTQISDTGELKGLVAAVIAEHPQAVADFKAGKKKAVGALVGQIMKATKGQANPQVVNQLLAKKLSEL